MNRISNYFFRITVISVLLVSAKQASAFQPGKKGFLIKGHVTGLTADSVYLYNTLTNAIKTAAVKQENFEFRGNLEFPEMYQVYYDKEMNTWTDLFLENTEITINGDIHALKNIQVKGSNANDEYLAWRSTTAEMRKSYRYADSLLTVAQDKPDYEAADSLETMENAIAHQMLEQIHQYAGLHRNSPVVPYLTYSASFNDPDKLLANKIIALVDNSEKKNPRIDSLNSYFNMREKIAVGRTAPDFEIASVDGKRFHLREYQGKVVLIDFWASWCGPCVKSIPELKAVYQKFAGENFELVGFSIDKSKSDWENALAKHQPPGTQVVELKGPDGTAPRDYGILFIPTLYLVDKEGKIAGINLHGKKLVQKIEELMK